MSVHNERAPTEQSHEVETALVTNLREYLFDVEDTRQARERAQHIIGLLPAPEDMRSQFEDNRSVEQHLDNLISTQPHLQPILESRELFDNMYVDDQQCRTYEDVIEADPDIANLLAKRSVFAGRPMCAARAVVVARTLLEILPNSGE